MAEATNVTFPGRITATEKNKGSEITMKRSAEKANVIQVRWYLRLEHLSQFNFDTLLCILQDKSTELGGSSLLRALLLIFPCINIKGRYKGSEFRITVVFSF